MGGNLSYLRDFLASSFFYSQAESTPAHNPRTQTIECLLYCVMMIEFKGDIFYWRGPAPFLFVAVPEEPSRDLKAISAMVTYGWGVVPVHVRIGKTEWKTSLFPKEGRYLVPIRMSVQKAENLKVGDSVVIQLEVN
jgi:hypothetical protein